MSDKTLEAWKNIKQTQQNAYFGDSEQRFRSYPITC